MAEPEVYSVPAPDFALQLNAVDLSNSIAYPNALLSFQLRPDTSSDTVILVLGAALRRLVHIIPWLASNLIPNPDEAARPMAPAIVEPGTLDLLIDRPTDLHISTLKPKDIPWSIWPARPPLVPNFSLFGCRIKANFTPDNGLLLAFTINHAFADGFTYVEVIRLLSEQCRLVQTTSPESRPPATPLPGIFDRSAMSNRPPSHPLTETQNLRLLPSIPAQPPPPTTPPTDRLYHIPAPAITALKPPSSPSSADKPTPSSHDTLLALLWHNIMRGRLSAGTIKLTDTVSFATAVDLRRWMPKHADYLGCAVSTVYVELPARELLGLPAGDVVSTAQTATVEEERKRGISGIQAGARAIRQQLLALTPKSAVTDLLDLYSSAPHLQLISIKGMDHLSTTHCFSTSWHRFSVSRFDWGPAFGVFGRYWMPRGGMLGGMFAVLPEGREGGFGVQVCLEEGGWGGFEGGLWGQVVGVGG